MTVGRPTKYQDEVTVERVREYFYDSLLVAGDNVPTIEGLAVYLGISKETVYDWKKKHPAFSDAIKRGESHQVRAIANLLTDKERFTAGTIFVAKNVLGWKDKTENTTTHTIKEFEVVSDDEG